MIPIEVITSVQRRRRWSAAEKKAMVREAEQPGMNISMELLIDPFVMENRLSVFTELRFTSSATTFWLPPKESSGDEYLIVIYQERK